MTNTIPRKYLLDSNVPSEFLGDAQEVDCDYLRTVAAILLYATQPVTLPPAVTEKTVKTLALDICAKRQHSPQPFPKADKIRDGLICRSLFVLVFPKLGGNALASVTATLQGKGLAMAFSCVREKFGTVVAKRLPLLAKSAKDLASSARRPAPGDATSAGRNVRASDARRRGPQ